MKMCPWINHGKQFKNSETANCYDEHKWGTEVKQLQPQNSIYFQGL